MLCHNKAVHLQLVMAQDSLIGQDSQLPGDNDHLRWGFDFARRSSPVLVVASHKSALYLIVLDKAKVSRGHSGAGGGAGQAG